MKKFLFLCMACAVLCLQSCNNEYDTTAKNVQDEINITNVKMLTEHMRSLHNGTSYREINSSVRRLPNPNFTKNDKMKIALADGKGALKGAITGGVWGALGNAAVSSVLKATKIYACKSITGYFENHFPSRIPSSANGSSIEDSIGYYHNIVEYTMYQIQADLYTLPTTALYMQADSIMRHINQEYANTTLSQNVINAIISDVNSLRAIDTNENMSFIQYVDALIDAYPDEADYIDMLAQYIYDVNYANENLDDYTNDILWYIGTSDLTDEEIQVLKYAVLVTYSSILYNASMTYVLN